MDLPVVTKVRVLRPYVLEVTFANGEERTVDVESELHGEVFEPLRDPGLFCQARIDTGTVVWPNGADFAPEFLYDPAGKDD